MNTKHFVKYLSEVRPNYDVNTIQTSQKTCFQSCGSASVAAVSFTEKIWI